MLPTSGYFKSTECPFDKAALCLRPHCHYKHVKPATNLDKGKYASAAEETEYLFETGPNVNLLHLSKSVFHPQSELIVDSPENATYIPTPVDKCVKKPVSILKTSNSNANKPSTSYVPEYKPTPLSKLKELNISHGVEIGEYSPDYSGSFRKKKKIEEYDPTEVRCVAPKKTVTFDETSYKVGNECIPAFSSSDDDLDDSASAPKFSDDDLDDDVVEVPKIRKPEPAKVVIEIEDEDKEEKTIDQFSVVDKILDDCKKNEKLLSSKRKPVVTSKKIQSAKNKSKACKNNVEASTKTIAKSRIDNGEIYSVEDKTVCNDIYPIKRVIDDEEIYSVNSTLFLESEPSYSSEIPTDLDILHLQTIEENFASNNEKDNNTNLNTSENSSSTVRKAEKKKVIDKAVLKASKSDCSNTSKAKEKSYKDTVKSFSEKSKHNKNKTNCVSDTVKSNSGDKKCKSNSGDKKCKSNSRYKICKSEKSKSTSETINKNTSLKVSKKEPSDKKEAKLQDEKVTSSSVVKTNKHEKSSKKCSGSELIAKSKNLSTRPGESKACKRKVEVDTDVKCVSIKDESKTSLETNMVAVKKARNDSFSDDDNGSVILSSSDSDPDEECWRIYNETFQDSVAPAQFTDKEVSAKENDSSSQDLLIKKKRYAHSASTVEKRTPSGAKPEPKPYVNPGQVMHNRYAQLKAMYDRQNEEKAKNMLNQGKSPDRKRISIVPNPSLLAAVTQKNKLNQVISPLNDFSPLPPTVSKTLKVAKRVAHLPDVLVKPRPVIPADYGSKVPTNVRQKYLNAFIDEYLKFSLSEDEAYDDALSEEKRAYERSSSKAIYMNVASNALTRLRHKAEAVPEASGGKKSDGVSSTTGGVSHNKTVSHEAVLNGPLAQRRSFSIQRKKTVEVPEIKGAALYEHLSTYVLSDDQLKQNGYPLPHPAESGRAIIEGIYANKIQYCNDPFKRTCCRCQKVYYVNVDGDYVRDEECDFHWGRLWKRRIAGSFESRYSCCQGDSESDGCCVSIGHVFEGSEAHALKGYVRTLPKTPPPDKYYGIYALDCEMCYTTAGMELTRITVVGTDLKPVYETFIKPQNKVIDYNTRFSGITEDDLKNVRTSLRDVQAVLLCIFNDKTILIGHSLESDFKALKLFHKTVVDTSVVFPHKMGLPYKRALRTLMAEKLNKIIQNDVGGHDSNEDAVSCMELMLWKIKEDVKGNR